jgi:adenylate kinase family enzyme
MTRIFITGNAGSGKTTLAKHIGEHLDLPVFGLDEIVWRPGWRKSPADWRVEKIAALIAPEAWVIEGVSATVLQAADFVFFLDVDRRTSLFRCARRNWRYLFRSRPGLPENCPEILIIPKLMRIIWYFPARVRPGILAALAARADSSWIVRRPADIEAALSALQKCHVEHPFGCNT